MNAAAETLKTLNIEWNSEEDLLKIDESFVKRNYRKLALKLHPDKNRNDPNAEAKFNHLKSAHDTMMDTGKRNEYIQILRVQLQRKKERELQSLDKQKFSDDLERREADYAEQRRHRDGMNSVRARHRGMVDELHAKRGLVKSTGGSSSLTHPAPDDTKHDLNYWFTYGLGEPEDVRKDKQHRFLDFINQQLA